VTLLVFLCGEGSNDIGGLAAEPEYQSDDEGFFQPIIRRLSAKDVSFRGTQIKTLGREKIRGLTEAWSRKARQARALAVYERADAVVLAGDVDSSAGERASRLEAERRIEEIAEAMHAGFESLSGPPWVGATPCRTIEAWALGDLDAAFGVAGVARIELPKKPEELWGKPSDPASNHPKCVLKRVFGGSVSSSDYARIASEADLDVLSRECPLSFPSFAAAVTDALA
jgi:Domain of unknown function (DUF4276)